MSLAQSTRVRDMCVCAWVCMCYVCMCVWMYVCDTSSRIKCHTKLRSVCIHALCMCVYQVTAETCTHTYDALRHGCEGVCVCVCVCNVCRCVCIMLLRYTNAYLRRTCIHEHRSTRTYILIHTYVYIKIRHTCTNTHLACFKTCRLYFLSCSNMYIRAHACMHTQTQTQTHTYT